MAMLPPPPGLFSMTKLVPRPFAISSDMKRATSVELPARRERHHQADGLVRILLSKGGVAQRGRQEGVKQFHHAVNPYRRTGLSTRICLRTPASGAHTGSWLRRRPSSIGKNGRTSIGP